MQGREWALATLAAALLTAALLGFLPTPSEHCEASSDRPAVCHNDNETLYGVDGPTVLVPLGIPVAAALVGVAFRQRWAALVAAIVITLVALAGMMTIGLFVLPTALLAWVSFGRRTPP